MLMRAPDAAASLSLSSPLYLSARCTAACPAIPRSFEATDVGGPFVRACVCVCGTVDANRARFTDLSLAPARSRARPPRSPRPRRRSCPSVRPSKRGRASGRKRRRGRGGVCARHVTFSHTACSPHPPRAFSPAVCCSPLPITGRYKKRVLYTRRFVNAVPSFGKPRVRGALAARPFSSARTDDNVPAARRLPRSDEHGCHPGREARWRCGQACRCRLNDASAVYSANKKETKHVGKDTEGETDPCLASSRPALPFPSSAPSHPQRRSRSRNALRHSFESSGRYFS